MKNILLALTLLLNFNLLSQSPLDLKEIMKGKEFIGNWPSNAFWHMNGEDICFRWNPENEIGDQWYIFSTKSNATRKIKPEEEYTIEAFDKEQAAFENQYYSSQGHLYKYNKKDRSYLPIFTSDKGIFNVQRVKNPHHVYFQMDINLYLYNAKLGTTKQITHFKKGKESKDKEESDFLRRQQIELFDYIQEEQDKKEFYKQQKAPNLLAEEHFIGDNSLELVSISPLENEIYFLLSDYPKNKNTEYSAFVTASGQTESKNARPKAGSAEASHKLGCFLPNQDTVIYIDFSQLPDIRKKPQYLSLYGDSTTQYDQDRKIVMHRVQFSQNGHAVVDIRSYDNKDRWIVALEKQKVQLIDHQHDEAWIGGPGIGSWNRSTGTLGWLPDNSTVYFQSEESGYSHLYTFNKTDNKKVQLTEGSFEIREVELSKNGEQFFIHANRSHPGNRGFYSLSIKTKQWTNILTEEGGFEVDLSPDEKNLAILYSSSTQPWELYWAKNTAETITRKITESRSEAFRNYNWHQPEVIDFLGQDQKNVYARIYQPKPDKKNGAAVVFVHGAGYLQNAHHYWSGYYREFMFHNLLREQGYTVLDIDYRASDGYGRDYRTAIYRHMGGWDLKDQLSGKQLLVDKYGIDPEKVGIYGGSYGGFITLMALLTEPGEFACGAALRSVTDWAHYNHEYTTNILNYPENDTIAYRQSSPIYFADKLEDPLLILHGMVDDNVQFQDVVRLSQRFIELGKTDWEMAIFPVEAHGFVKSSSWHDEYRRIFELFNQHLLKP